MKLVESIGTSKVLTVCGISPSLLQEKVTNEEYNQEIISENM